MNAPDPGTKLNIIYDKNPLFAFDSAVSTSSAKSYRNDGLIGRYIMLQASSPLKFREIAIFNSRNQLESSTSFHVKKGVATESLECPASHPYAFRGGSQCCAGYRERDDSSAPGSGWPSGPAVILTGHLARAMAALREDVPVRPQRLHAKPPSCRWTSCGTVWRVQVLAEGSASARACHFRVVVAARPHLQQCNVHATWGAARPGRARCGSGSGPCSITRRCNGPGKARGASR